MFKRTASLAATFAAVTVSLVMGATSAVADPTFVPDSTDIVGVGDPTTQGLMNAMADAYNTQDPVPVDLLASFDGTGPSPITPKAGCEPIARPANSTQGIAALTADTLGCIDFARSRRAPIAAEEALVFLPYAYDGISWAVANTSNAPQSLSRAELAAIYRCTARTWADVGGTSTELIRPFLPARTSIERGFFLSAIGVGAPGSCVRTGTTTGQLAQPESFRKRNFIGPLSIPAFLQLGPAPEDPANYPRLGSVEAAGGTPVAPVVDTADGPGFNTGFLPQFIRPMYNVVERDPATQGVPARLAPVFLNTTSNPGFICSSAGQAVVIEQGFGSLPPADGCGIG